MTVTAHYMRYHVAYEEECDSVEEAFRFLTWGEDQGSLSSVRVVADVEVYERDTPEFQRRLFAAWHEI